MCVDSVWRLCRSGSGSTVCVCVCVCGGGGCFHACLVTYRHVLYKAVTYSTLNHPLVMCVDSRVEAMQEWIRLHSGGGGGGGSLHVL